mgnify:CR=1 FL=1
MLPIPMPGLSLVLGTLMASIGIAFLLGKAPWIPRWLRERPLPQPAFSKIFMTASRAMQRLEFLLRPRLLLFVRNLSVQKTAGLCIAVCGILLALPLPPGTNFPPAFASFGLSLGLLEDDGLMLIFGFVFYVITLIFFFVIFYFGFEVLHWAYFGLRDWW